MAISFASLATAISDTFGEAVTYTSPAGVSTSISLASLTPTELIERGSEQGTEMVVTRQCFVKKSALAAPDKDGKITISGEVWAIELVENARDIFWRFNLIRRLTAERARPMYRIK